MNLNVKLKPPAVFTLFLTSYTPLLVLIVVKQMLENKQNMNYGGFTVPSLLLFLENFGLSTLFLCLILFGILGALIVFRNIENRIENGNLVEVSEISNRNGEAIGYIATYIIPFLYDGFDDAFSIFSVIFLLIIIYLIYIKSSMLLINPVLSFFYSIYEIKYIQGSFVKSGLIISRDSSIEESDNIKIYPLGYKLFYSKKLDTKI